MISKHSISYYILRNISSISSTPPPSTIPKNNPSFAILSPAQFHHSPFILHSYSSFLFFILICYFTFLFFTLVSFSFFVFISLFQSSWEKAACFLSVDQSIIPQRAVWKSLPGWIMLTRRHAEEVRTNVRAWECVCVSKCVYKSVYVLSRVFLSYDVHLCT